MGIIKLSLSRSGFLGGPRASHKALGLPRASWGDPFHGQQPMKNCFFSLQKFVIATAVISKIVGAAGLLVWFYLFLVFLLLLLILRFDFRSL